MRERDANDGVGETENEMQDRYRIAVNEHCKKATYNDEDGSLLKFKTQNKQVAQVVAQIRKDLEDLLKKCSFNGYQVSNFDFS